MLIACPAPPAKDLPPAATPEGLPAELGAAAGLFVAPDAVSGVGAGELPLHPTATNAAAIAMNDVSVIVRMEVLARQG